MKPPILSAKIMKSLVRHVKQSTHREKIRNRIALRSLASKSAGELDILGLDGDTFGMDGAKVGIFKERDKVCFNRLLESTDGR